MAYNQINFYKRVLEVQTIVLREQRLHSGITLTFIYKNHIKDKFFISYSTFNRWLGIPAKRDLDKLQSAKARKQSD